jgi:endonuclease/exonuclease/phosphatase family metal-dependent hydrolase
MKLSVLQWNVWFDEAADNIVQLVREINADIVCLQELTTDSVINPDRDIPAEIESLGYDGLYTPTFERTGEKHISRGNGIFSKFPIAASRQIYVQREDPKFQDYRMENRTYSEVKLDINSTGLTVGTTHLSYIPKFTITNEKRKEVDKLVDAIGVNNNRFILAGDFNSMPDSYTIEQLSQILKSAGPDFSEATWTTKPFDYGEFKGDALDWRLDYVFATPDIKVLNSRIVQTKISDHLPILIEIEI